MAELCMHELLRLALRSLRLQMACSKTSFSHFARFWIFFTIRPSSCFIAKRRKSRAQKLLSKFAKFNFACWVILNGSFNYKVSAGGQLRGSKLPILSYNFILLDTKSAKVLREKLYDLYPDISQTSRFNHDRFKVITC